MIEFLIDVLQIAIMIKLAIVGFKWLFFRKKKKYKRTSIAKKITMLVTNKIHYKLDTMLKEQRKAFKVDQESSDGKIIPIRKTQ